MFRQGNLIEVLQTLGPEIVAPGPVQLLDAAIAPATPALEGLQSILRVVSSVVPSIFIAYMPGNHSRIVTEVLSHDPAKAKGIASKNRRGGPPGLSSPRMDQGSIRLHGQHLRMCLVKPVWGRSRSRSHVYGDTGFS